MNSIRSLWARTFIVLALEGRFENFRLGRDIEWERVSEIYKMGLKHGMKLAAISGVNGVFSDEDIARVKRIGAGSQKKAKETQVASTRYYLLSSSRLKCEVIFARALSPLF